MAARCFLGFVLIGGLGFGFQSAPRVLHRVEPNYSREARRNFIQGTVVLEVVVDESGKPGDISVVSPLGFGLDERAVQAVSKWLFEPVKGVATVEVNFRLFHHWFNAAPEERRTSFNLAVDSIQRQRQNGRTLEILKNLAGQKYPPAMYIYAKMVQAGEGFPQDPDLAFALILEAAEKHYPQAMYEIGRMKMQGRRLPKDPEQGLELVRNAAVLGSRPAQFFLGAAYASGDAVPQDASRAYQYFRMCAVKGETPCQVRLAKLLLDRSEGSRDVIQAIVWLELASEHRNEEARMILNEQQVSLSAEQVTWVTKLKTQLAQPQP